MKLYGDYICVSGFGSVNLRVSINSPETGLVFECFFAFVASKAWSLNDVGQDIRQVLQLVSSSDNMAGKVRC